MIITRYISMVVERVNMFFGRFDGIWNQVDRWAESGRIQFACFSFVLFGIFLCGTLFCVRILMAICPILGG